MTCDFLCTASPKYKSKIYTTKKSKRGGGMDIEMWLIDGYNNWFEKVYPTDFTLNLHRYLKLYYFAHTKVNL